MQKDVEFLVSLLINFYIHSVLIDQVDGMLKLIVEDNSRWTALSAYIVCIWGARMVGSSLFDVAKKERGAGSADHLWQTPPTI